MPFVPTEKIVLGSAREEVSWRLKNRIAPVKSVPERQAVLDVRKKIIEGRGFPAQSDALATHFTGLVDVLAGPFPALARVEAARAIGEIIAKDNSMLNHRDFLRSLEAMQTGPDLREGPIAHGAWLEAIGKTPDFLQKKFITAVGEDNPNDAKRLALSMAAMEVFTELKGAFLDMEMPEWTRMNANLSISGYDLEEGEKRPKCVIKMGSREVTQVDDRGIIEYGTRLPTRKSMAIVAHLGVPIHGRFNIGGESDQRNLSILLAEPKLATRKAETDDMQLEKWRGIRLPAFDIPSEDSLGAMEEILEGTGNCLLPQVLKLVSSGTLPWNIAIRVSRELHTNFDTSIGRRQALSKVLSRHLTKLQQPVVLEKWKDGKQVGSESTTILASHLEEFNNRVCGLLKSKEITEKKALEILETTVTAVLCTKEPDGDLDIVRSEPELVRVLEMLMKQRMLPEDKKRYPTLIGGAGEMKAETIRSESTPLKVLPEMIKD